MAKTFDGRTAPLTVCDNLYPSVETTKGKLHLPKLESKTDVGVDIAVSLMESVLGSPAEAKAALGSVSSVEIEWGEITALEVPQEKLFKPDGTPLAIHPACFAAMQRYKQAEGPSGLIMVQAAALAHSMKYTFKAKQGAELGAGIDLKNKMTVKAGAKVTQEGNTVLVINEPTYIGFVAFAITDATPIAGFAGPRATVAGFALSPDQLKTLLRP